MLTNLCASTVAVVVFAGIAAAQGPSPAPVFSADELTSLPIHNWPTNGGNLYNQRYSPLDQVDRENVRQLKGVWRAQLDGSGVGPNYSGEA